MNTMDFWRVVCGLFLGVRLLLAAPPAGYAEPLCQTAFARISKVELQKLVDQHDEDACKVLKFNIGGFTVALDNTKELSLHSFEVCEDGPAVTLKSEVSVSCATSDGAYFQATVSSTVAASASVNCHTCTVDALDIKAGDSTVQSAIDFFEAPQKAKDYLSTAIKPYCDP